MASWALYLAIDVSVVSPNTFDIFLATAKEVPVPENTKIVVFIFNFLLSKIILFLTLLQTLKQFSIVFELRVINKCQSLALI
jgi:hypothetical protein